MPHAFILFWSLLFAAQAQRTPAITLSAIQATDGDLVELRGSGFTPNKTALSHLMKPNNTEYPVLYIQTNERGEFSHTIETLLLLPGTHEIWVVDDVTSAVSNRLRFTVGFGDAAPAPPEVTDALEPYAGVWRGSVTRSDSGKAGVLLAITGKTGAIAGTVAYPDRSCGGVLVFRTISSGSIDVTEMITYGHDRCLNNGQTTLKISPEGTMSFEWRHPDRPQTAAGSLTPAK
jgi:hypothetical protein